MLSHSGPVSPELPDLGVLEIDIEAAREDGEIGISRVRRKPQVHSRRRQNRAAYSRVERLISFCLAYDLNREEEIQLFKDINKNQNP